MVGAATAEGGVQIAYDDGAIEVICPADVVARIAADDEDAAAAGRPGPLLGLAVSPPQPARAW